MISGLIVADERHRRIGSCDIADLDAHLRTNTAGDIFGEGLRKALRRLAFVQSEKVIVRGNFDLRACAVFFKLNHVALEAQVAFIVKHSHSVACVDLYVRNIGVIVGLYEGKIELASGRFYISPDQFTDVKYGVMS